MLLNLTCIKRWIYQVHLNSTPLVAYGSIKSIRVQPFISTTTRLRDKNIVWIEGNMASFDHKTVSAILSQFMGLIPIPLNICRMTRLVNPLISGSARLFSFLTYSKEMISCFSSCFITPCLMWMCLFFPLYTLLCATLIVICEWQWRKIAVGCLAHSGISPSRPFNHSLS